MSKILEQIYDGGQIDFFCRQLPRCDAWNEQGNKRRVRKRTMNVSKPCFALYSARNSLVSFNNA